MPRPEVSSPTKAFWDSGPAGSRRVSWPMEPWQSRGRNMEKSLFKLFVICIYILYIYIQYTTNIGICDGMYIYIIIYILYISIYIYIYMKLWAGYADQPSDFRGPISWRHQLFQLEWFNWCTNKTDFGNCVSIIFVSSICYKQTNYKEPLFLESNDVCLWCNKHVQSLSDGGPGIQGSLFTATRLKTRATEVPVDQSGNLNMGRFRKITCNDWIQKELRYV
jgi:hypothetical protein